MDNSTNFENKMIDEVKRVVLDMLGSEPVKIVLFGSRTSKRHNRFSDIDIGVLPGSSGFNSIKLVLLREKLENINIPYKVDVVNLSRTTDKFRETALKNSVVWKS